MKDSKRTVALRDVLSPHGYIRGPFGSALRRSELAGEGIPVYEQQHAINNGRRFRFYVGNRKYEELKRFAVMPGDLIISCSGTVGRVSIIREDDPRGIISQALLLLRADRSKVLPKYLYWYFRSREGYHAIVSRSSGSVQANIAKREVIEQIPLYLPPLSEQEEIVGVLEAAENKIEINERINNNLGQQARAVFAREFLSFKSLPGG